MIVLGKDKVDERYNISDDGIITDLQGNVQETRLPQGRPKFKGIAVHRILMWTKFGYKDLDIHHLDHDPLNNNINNLVFLTRSEHMKIHMTGKRYMQGKKFSEEHKKKISLARKGRPRSEETKQKLSLSHKGKTLSEETKKKISLAFKGKHWKIDETSGKRRLY